MIKKQCLVLKAIKLDFDAHWAFIFFVLVAIAGAISQKPAILLAISPFFVVSAVIVIRRCFAIRKILNSGTLINARIERLLQPAGSKSLNSLKCIDGDTQKGLYFAELVYEYSGREYDETYRFRHVKTSPALYRGENIDIQINPHKPESLLIKKLWE